LGDFSEISERKGGGALDFFAISFILTASNESVGDATG